MSVRRGEAGDSTGKKGEKIAAAYLRSVGYNILCMNYRFRRCEVDIIARDGETMVFIEVKTRRSLRFGHPILSITPSKKRNILKVAGAFVEKNNFPCSKIRFDVLTVIFAGNKPLVDHVRDAFRS